jgi:hypothetical protein
MRIKSLEELFAELNQLRAKVQRVDARTKSIEEL